MSHLFKPNRESMSWIILYDFQVMKKFLYSKRIMQYILSYIKDVLRINSTALWILYGWRFIMCAQIEVTTVLHIIVVIVSRPWHANASNFTDFIICEYQHLHMSTILVFFLQWPFIIIFFPFITSNWWWKFECSSCFLGVFFFQESFTQHFWSSCFFLCWWVQWSFANVSTMYRRLLPI